MDGLHLQGNASRRHIYPARGGGGRGVVGMAEGGGVTMHSMPARRPLLSGMDNLWRIVFYGVLEYLNDIFCSFSPVAGHNRAYCRYHLPWAWLLFACHFCASGPKYHDKGWPDYNDKCARTHAKNILALLATTKISTTKIIMVYSSLLWFEQIDDARI